MPKGPNDLENDPFTETIKNAEAHGPHIPFDRYVAGLRYLEGTCIQSPLLTDPLAGQLCGSHGMSLARKELSDLQEAQGHVGKHLRVPARSRIVDDEILSAISKLVLVGETSMQVKGMGWFRAGWWGDDQIFPMLLCVFSAPYHTHAVHAVPLSSADCCSCLIVSHLRRSFLLVGRGLAGLRAPLGPCTGGRLGVWVTV
jgi:hypothetical protein